MSTLDWSKIDNDTSFHRLMNGLFTAELGVLEYVPGDPDRGADRGLDGFRHWLEGAEFYKDSIRRDARLESVGNLRLPNFSD